MKLKISLLFAIFISTFCNGQSYQRMLTDSITEFEVNIFCLAIREQNPQQTQSNCIDTHCYNTGSPNDWIAKGDSSFNGKTYKKITYNSSFQGLMREDTIAKKVYFIQYCNTTEDLLYDFSLSQGGTINYTFPNTAGFIQSGTCTVDSIVVMHDYLTYYRKHFYLRNHGGGNYLLELIEGVGSVNHPLFLYYTFQQSMFFSSPSCVGVNYDQALGCKINNGKRVYFDSCAYSIASAQQGGSQLDSCVYCLGFSGGVSEVNDQHSFFAYPNPNTGTFEIQTNRMQEQTIRIFDLTGKIVLKKTITHRARIDVGNLENGVYFISADTNEGIATQKIVIQH